MAASGTSEAGCIRDGRGSSCFETGNNAEFYGTVDKDATHSS